MQRQTVVNDNNETVLFGLEALDFANEHNRNVEALEDGRWHSMTWSDAFDFHWDMVIGGVGHKAVRLRVTKAELRSVNRLRK